MSDKQKKKERKNHQKLALKMCNIAIFISEYFPIQTAKFNNAKLQLYLHQPI